MGKKIYIERVRDFIGLTPVFRGEDIERIVKDKRYAHLMLYILTKKGEINRLSKDCYSRYGDPIIAVYCFRPAYIGLQEALSIHGLWEQETITIILTVRRARVGIRKILNSNIMIRRISPKYFFGFELIPYNNIYIPVSDIEKTLIDIVYFNERIDKSIYREIKEKINIQKLNNYLTYYQPRIKKKIEELLDLNRFSGYRY